MLLWWLQKKEMAEQAAIDSLGQTSRSTTAQGQNKPSPPASLCNC